MSREPQEVELYNGRLDAARVRVFAGKLFEPRTVCEYFVCGPGNMIEHVSATLGELGVEPVRMHAEHFTLASTGEPAAAPVVAGPDAAHAAAPAAAARGEGVCEVSVLMDGRRRSFTMDIGEETVLDAAARAGVELPFSCRAGVCSTCRTKVVLGGGQHDAELRARGLGARAGLRARLPVRTRRRRRSSSTTTRKAAQGQR